MDDRMCPKCGWPTVTDGFAEACGGEGCDWFAGSDTIPEQRQAIRASAERALQRMGADQSSPVPIPQPALEALQRLEGWAEAGHEHLDDIAECVTLVRRHLSLPSSGRPEPSEEALMAAHDAWCSDGPGTFYEALEEAVRAAYRVDFGLPVQEQGEKA
jgi:hypothetical protein